MTKTKPQSTDTLLRVVTGGPFVTILTAIALELLSRTPLYIPAPGIVLMLAVVYGALRDGTTGGLISAALAAGYNLHAGIAHAPINDPPGSPRSELVVALALPLVAVLVGWLRQQLDQVTDEERRMHEVAERQRRTTLELMETMTDGLVHLRNDWTVTYANGRAEQLLETPREELIGCNALEVFPNAIGTPLQRAIAGALESRAPIEFEEYYEPGHRWFEVRIFRSDAHFAIYFRDITRRRRAQEAVRFQGKMLDAIGQPVLATDLDGHIVYWNSAAEALFGWNSDEVTGKSVLPLTQAGYSELDDARLFSRLRSGHTWTGDILLLRKNGETFTGVVSDTPIHDDDGHLLGMVRIVTDLSVRKSVEEEQRFLAEAGSALASTLDYESTVQTVAQLGIRTLADCCFVYMAEQNGSIQRIATAHVNPRKEEIAREVRRRYPLEATSNHPVAQVIRSGLPTLIKTLSDHLLRSIAIDSGHLGMMRALGYHSGMFVPLIARGRTLGAIVLLISESNREYNEDDLRRAEDLALRAAIAIDNARLYEAAVLASRAKSDFLAVVSHELRTPLTTIMGYTDLLLAGVPKPLADKEHIYVERIRTAAWHLLGLIEQILIYARLEVGREQVHPQRIDVAAVLQEAASLIEPIAQEKGLGFGVESPSESISVDTDLTKLRQVLLNLLSNAVKFTEEGEIAFSAARENGWVNFSVRDTGVGIAPEYLEKVFEAFWQVDQSATRLVGGAGLGLSVARRLARLLGGEVEVTSDVGKGTVFTARIPMHWSPDVFMHFDVDQKNP